MSTLQVGTWALLAFMWRVYLIFTLAFGGEWGELVFHSAGVGAAFYLTLLSQWVPL